MTSFFSVTGMAGGSIGPSTSSGRTVSIYFGRAEQFIYFPLPPLATQHAIVAQIEEEQRLVNANKELIRIFEEKIKATINRVWGEESNENGIGGNGYQTAKDAPSLAAEGVAGYRGKT